MRHSAWCPFRLARFSFKLKLYLSAGFALNLNALCWINTGAQMRTRPRVWDFGCTEGYDGCWSTSCEASLTFINAKWGSYGRCFELHFIHQIFLLPPYSALPQPVRSQRLGGLAMCAGGSICSRLFWNQLESACVPGALQMSNSTLLVLCSDMQALVAARHWRWPWLNSDTGIGLKKPWACCIKSFHTRTPMHPSSPACYTTTIPLLSRMIDDMLEFHSRSSVLELLWRPGIYRLWPGIELHQRETTARAFKRLNKQLLLISLRIMGELSFTKYLLFTPTIDRSGRIPRSWPQCRFNSSSFQRARVRRIKFQFFFSSWLKERTGLPFQSRFTTLGSYINPTVYEFFFLLIFY